MWCVCVVCVCVVCVVCVYVCVGVGVGVGGCIRSVLSACSHASISLDVIIALDIRAEHDAPLLPGRCTRANRGHPTSVVSFRHSRYGAKVTYIEEVVEI